MTDPLYTRPCKLCGVDLAILRTGDGKAVALDLSVKVYAPVINGTCVQTHLSYADHKDVCLKLDRTTQP